MKLEMPSCQTPSIQDVFRRSWQQQPRRGMCPCLVNLTAIVFALSVVALQVLIVPYYVQINENSASTDSPPLKIKEDVTGSLYMSNATDSFWFPNKKRMAYVSTWDDTNNIKSYQYINAATTLFNLTMPLTLNLEIYTLFRGGVGVVEEYEELLRKGHALESHTVTHNNYAKNNYLGKGGGPNEAFEYVDSQRILRDTFGPGVATTFAYPHGLMPSNETVRVLMKGIYMAARSTKKGFFKRGDNLMELLCHSVEKIRPSHLDEATRNGYALISMGHGIQGISGWRPIDKDTFHAHIAALAERGEDIWFVTLPGLVNFLVKTGQVTLDADYVQ